MLPEDDFILSFYIPIATIDSIHNIVLVKHISTGILYIKKILTNYNLTIYMILREKCFPHIPIIKELIEDTEHHELIIIEEFINGRTLNNLLEEKGTLSEAETVNLTILLCNILQPLHCQKSPIIHRDIKPSNLILNLNNNLILLDFNTARFYNPEQSKDTVFMGTKSYAAPEQYGYSQTDVRSDIYAIGITMIELLTGTPDRETKISGHINKIIQKCTAIDPANRYSSIDKLRHDLTSLHIKPLPTNETYNNSNHNDINYTTCSWIPPGFRTKTPWKIATAILGYLMLILCGCNLTVTNKDHPVTSTDLLFNRVSFLFAGILIILFSFNYKNIHHFFPTFKYLQDSIDNTFLSYILRLLFIIFCDTIILVIVVAFIVIIESIFF